MRFLRSGRCSPRLTAPGTTLSTEERFRYDVLQHYLNDSPTWTLEADHELLALAQTVVKRSDDASSSCAVGLSKGARG